MNEINDKKRLAENVSQLVALQQSLGWDIDVSNSLFDTVGTHMVVQEISLVIPTRRFLKKGTFKKVVKDKICCKGDLILFNDILLATREKGIAFEVPSYVELSFLNCVHPSLCFWHRNIVVHCFSYSFLHTHTHPKRVGVCMEVCLYGSLSLSVCACVCVCV